MKLSEKGFYTLKGGIRTGYEWGYHENIDNARNVEFEPDDFTGAVVLSAFEAASIAGCLRILERDDNNRQIANLWATKLTERIKQCENE